MSTTKPVTVRHFTYADAQRLADGETVEVYRGYVDGMLPMTLKAQRRHDDAPRVDAVYPTIDEQAINGRAKRYADKTAEPVGHRVHVVSRTPFGTEGGTIVYTTPQAEIESDRLGNYGKNAASGTEFLFVDDPDGGEAHTVPIYGSQVSLTLFVADVDHEDALERVTAAIEAQFAGANMLRIHRPTSRPVHDRRVNVLVDGKTIAVNVLDAEAHYYANVGCFNTQPVGNGVDQVVVGL